MFLGEGLGYKFPGLWLFLGGTGFRVRVRV